MLPLIELDRDYSLTIDDDTLAFLLLIYAVNNRARWRLLTHQ